MEPVIFLVEKAEEGGYNAKAAGHSIFTQGDRLTKFAVIFRMQSGVILMIITPLLLSACK